MSKYKTEEVVLMEKDNQAANYRLAALKRWLKCHGQSRNVKRCGYVLL